VLPQAKAFAPGEVHYRGDVVTWDGCTFQAKRDTATQPPSDSWTLLAAAGRNGRDAKWPEVKGLYAEAAEYRCLDIVASDGGSFIAVRDKPGPCPGDGWQMIARQGRRGGQGPKGDPGAPGARGQPGPAAPAIASWRVDRDEFQVFAVMTDGSEAPAMELRELFEQYQIETR
jgi:hypothetical protein